MNLTAVRYAEIDRNSWDAFVHTSDEAWLWHTYDFQYTLDTWRYYEAISIALIDKDTGTIVAVLPLFLIKGIRIDSFGGYAATNDLPPKQLKALLGFVEEYLGNLARKHAVGEIHLTLPPMARSYAGERCPLVNPLLWIGCENTLTQTWVVDLRGGKEAVWNNMDGRARTAVRKAEKNGVTVRHAAPNDLDTYYALHCNTYRRTGATPHPEEYFRAIWERFLPDGRALILIAEHDKKTLAMGNFAAFKSNGLYWTGASSEQGLDLEANSLIQWRAIEWMIDKRFTLHEIGEAFPHARSGKEKGLNDFKSSFGGKLYPYYKGRLSFSSCGKRSLYESLMEINLRKAIAWFRGPAKRHDDEG